MVSSLDPEGELLLIRAKPGWARLGSSRRVCVQARIRVDPADISGQDMSVGPAAQQAVDVGALIIFEIALQARDDRIWTWIPVRKKVVLAQPRLHSGFAHFLVEVGQPQ